MKIFDIDYIDIYLDDKPPKGEAIVCLDPKERLGKGTWAVLESQGRDIVATARGLFWDQKDAIAFAELIDDQY